MSTRTYPSLSGGAERLFWFFIKNKISKKRKMYKIKCKSSSVQDSDDEKEGPKFIYNVPFHSLNFVDDFTLDDEDYLNCPIDPVGVPPYQKYPSPYLLKGKK